MLFQGGFTFTNFIADVFAVFVFVVWFSLVFTVLADLLRRSDISGWGKAIWVILAGPASVHRRVRLPRLARPWDGRAERNNVPEPAMIFASTFGLSAGDETEKLTGEEFGPHLQRGIRTPPRQSGTVANACALFAIIARARARSSAPFGLID